MAVEWQRRFDHYLSTEVSLDHPDRRHLEALRSQNLAFIDRVYGTGRYRNPEVIEVDWNSLANQFQDRLNEGYQPGNFGSKLRSYRQRVDMSQRELAELLGIDATYLSRIEQGRRNPLGADKMIKAAQELLITPQEAIELTYLAGYQHSVLRDLGVTNFRLQPLRINE